MIDACETSANALLESPCGSGKTLALLCSTLSWLKRERKNNQNLDIKNPPKIVYCTSSHDMINSAINELKKTAYEPKMTIIGSRDCLCSNSKVNKYRGATLVSKCKQIRSSTDPDTMCQQFKNTTDKSLKIDWQVQDIEDLHSLAGEKTLCPYYFQKLKVTEADLVFITYENLLDPKQLANFNLTLSNTILIFDEAHNIEKRCEEISSFEFGVAGLRLAIGEMSELQKRINNASAEEAKQFTASIEDVENAKMLTQNFKDYMKVFDLNATDKIAHSKLSRSQQFRIYHRWSFDVCWKQDF